MKKFLFIIFTISFVLIIGCAQNSTNSEKKLTSNQFTWIPENTVIGLSNAANRYYYGIIDGDDKTLYYQSISNSGITDYALFSYNIKNNYIQELAPDCYGMINFANDSVYYIGYETKGVYQYDCTSRNSKLIYSDDIKNLLVVEKYIYIINSKNELIRFDMNGNNKELIMKDVLSQYLDYSDGFVYYAQIINISDNNYSLFKGKVSDSIQNIKVYDNIDYPIKYWDENILCRDINGIYLMNNKKIYLDIDDASNISVNGNGIFFTQTDKDGYTELKVYDLNTSKIFNLTPTHFSSIYFINNEIYVVDIVNFKAEVIDLTNPSYIHTVKIDL